MRSEAFGSVRAGAFARVRSRECVRGVSARHSQSSSNALGGGGIGSIQRRLNALGPQT